ncbi:MAG: DUF928 domain-containing protein [Cyanobacteria bacterium J06650_10]
MKFSRFIRFSAIVSGSLAITSAAWVLSPVQAQAAGQTGYVQISDTQKKDSRKNSRQLPQTEARIRYNPPNRGAPGDASTADAGSRSCGLMVFEPAQSHWGETMQPRPSFWLYASNPGTVSFSLSVEATAEVVYEETFDVTAGQTMTRYSLPETAASLTTSLTPELAPELTPNQAYRWAFMLDCPGDPDPSANGVIVRRETSALISSPTNPSDSLTQARQLAAAGFWFDAVDTLNQLRLNATEQSSTDPPNHASTATQDWLSLLRQGGWEATLGDQFEQVATAPFSPELSNMESEEACTAAVCTEESTTTEVEQ